MKFLTMLIFIKKEMLMVNVFCLGQVTRAFNFQLSPDLKSAKVNSYPDFLHNWRKNWKTAFISDLDIVQESETPFEIHCPLLVIQHKICFWKN